MLGKTREYMNYEVLIYHVHTLPARVMTSDDAW